MFHIPKIGCWKDFIILKFFSIKMLLVKLQTTGEKQNNTNFEKKKRNQSNNPKLETFFFLHL